MLVCTGPDAYNCLAYVYLSLASPASTGNLVDTMDWELLFHLFQSQKISRKDPGEWY